MKSTICLMGGLLAAALGGCASGAEKIQASYVSPVGYQGYSCGQLGAEARRVSFRVAELSGVQNQKATNDAIATTAAIILFAPAAFLIGGDDHTTAELSRLKGEFETIEKVSIKKNCGIKFRRVTIPKPKPKPAWTGPSDT